SGSAWLQNSKDRAQSSVQLHLELWPAVTLLPCVSTDSGSGRIDDRQGHVFSTFVAFEATCAEHGLRALPETHRADIGSHGFLAGRTFKRYRVVPCNKHQRWPPLQFSRPDRNNLEDKLGGAAIIVFITKCHTGYKNPVQ